MIHRQMQSVGGELGQLANLRSTTCLKTDQTNASIISHVSMRHREWMEPYVTQTRHLVCSSRPSASSIRKVNSSPFTNKCNNHKYNLKSWALSCHVSHFMDDVVISFTGRLIPGQRDSQSVLIIGRWQEARQTDRNRKVEEDRGIGRE